MSKPENSFIARIHKQLPLSIHREKTNNPYRRGTWDVWYSGSKADLWVEYKYLPKVPKRGEILPALTDLQAEWGIARHDEGRNLAVIVGCPQGGVLYKKPYGVHGWMMYMSAQEFCTLVQPVKYLTEWIRLQCED